MKSVKDFNDLRHTARIVIRVALGAISGIGFSIFVLLSVPIYFFRLTVIFLTKYIRPDLGEILDCGSCLFVNDLFTKKPPRSNIIVTLTMEGHLSFEEFQNEWIIKNWINAISRKTGELVYRKFQQYPYPWLGFIFWKNAFETFNIDNHVFMHSDFGNSYVTEEELTEFNTRLLNEPFHPERSPWAIHLIHNYRNPQNSTEPMSVIIFKIHHSLSDGFGILSALVEKLCGFPLSNMNMPVARYPPKQSFTDKIIELTKFPLNGLYELSAGLSSMIQPSPWKVPDESKAWYQFCGKSDLIPIQKVKDIKNAFGVGFTSVLLSAISAGIHKNLEEKKKRGFEFEDTGSLFCLSAMPLPGHSLELTNHCVGALFNIPTVAYHNPVERLQKCHSILESTKQSLIPNLTRLFVLAVGGHLASVCRVLAKNSAVSTGLSNFPSVPMVLTKGTTIVTAVDFAAGALQGSAGAGFMVLSYGQHIRFVMTAEKALMSKADINAFIACVIDEIETLHKTAV